MTPNTLSFQAYGGLLVLVTNSLCFTLTSSCRPSCCRYCIQSSLPYRSKALLFSSVLSSQFSVLRSQVTGVNYLDHKKEPATWMPLKLYTCTYNALALRSLLSTPKASALSSELLLFYFWRFAFTLKLMFLTHSKTFSVKFSLLQLLATCLLLMAKKSQCSRFFFNFWSSFRLWLLTILLLHLTLLFLLSSPWIHIQSQCSHFRSSFCSF